MAAQQGAIIAEMAAATGDDFVLMGDFNATPSESPALPLTANGMLPLADDVDSKPVERTRAEGRYIDYALHTTGFSPRSRRQDPGVGDHDLVSHTFEVGCLEPTYARRPCRQLDPERCTTDEHWRLLWTPLLL